MQDEERVEKDILKILYRQYKQRTDYVEGPLEDMMRWRISYYDLVTSIRCISNNVVIFYNNRGTTEQWIMDG